MARGPLKFRQSDIQRAVKAVRAAGLVVVKTEITSSGSIMLHHHDNDNEPLEKSALEEWEAKRNARPS